MHLLPILYLRSSLLFAVGCNYVPLCCHRRIVDWSERDPGGRLLHTFQGQRSRRGVLGNCRAANPTPSTKSQTPPPCQRESAQGPCAVTKIAVSQGFLEPIRPPPVTKGDRPGVVHRHCNWRLTGFPQAAHLSYQQGSKCYPCANGRASWGCAPSLQSLSCRGSSILSTRPINGVANVPPFPIGERPGIVRRHCNHHLTGVTGMIVTKSLPTTLRESQPITLSQVKVPQADCWGLPTG